MSVHHIRVGAAAGGVRAQTRLHDGADVAGALRSVRRCAHSHPESGDAGPAENTSTCAAAL